MGDHRKELNCSHCRGTGKDTASRDGKVEEVPCALCGGTGKA